MIKHWQGGAIAAGILVLFALTPVRADAPGVLWQMTSQMMIPGMPFSPRPNSVKVCTPAAWTAPPPSNDPTCVNTNFQRVGTNKVTWAMQCSGEMPMTGTGEITFAADGTYSGAINATADGMSMQIVLSGKKLGSCDNPIN